MNQERYKEIEVDGVTYEQVREPEQGSPCDACHLEKGDKCLRTDNPALEECLSNGTIWKRKDI